MVNGTFPAASSAPGTVSARRIYRPTDSAEHRYHVYMYNRYVGHVVVCSILCVRSGTAYNWRSDLLREAREWLREALGDASGDVAAVNYDYALRCYLEPETVLRERWQLHQAERAVYGERPAAAASGGAVEK